MNKTLESAELAEIVAGLIVDPTLLGQLDSSAEHDTFIRRISEVVASFCGGDIVAVDNGAITVSQNDSLPSPTDNVWSNHGTGNWSESNSVDVLALRKTLQSILSVGVNKSKEPVTLEYSGTMVDWRVNADEVEEKGDEQVYSIKACLDNQMCIEITDSQGEPTVGLLIEINHGVPALHIDTRGGDPLLHIHAAQGGLVLTLNDTSLSFQNAENDRHAYNQSGSLVIKDNFEE